VSVDDRRVSMTSRLQRDGMSSTWLADLDRDLDRDRDGDRDRDPDLDPADNRPRANPLHRVRRRRVAKRKAANPRGRGLLDGE
jgi:hypothetical protein